MEEIYFLDNVSILSKKKNITNINLKINKGDFFVIRGSNSSGKSLLLKLFCLKLLPSTGSLYLKGIKVSEDSKKMITLFRKKMGVILQNDFLIPFFSVYQNVELASQIQDLKSKFSDRMEEISEWLDLKEIKNEKIVNLSNSQKQKVVIARALINNPNIIIADQPETFLDEESRNKIFFLFESLSKIGSTIIMTSSFSQKVKIDHKTIELK